MDGTANPASEPAAPSEPAAIESDAGGNDSLLADPKFALCLQRLEAHWPKPKLKAPLLSLQRLGRFEIRRELGRGRFGVVFLAWDPRLQRQVALKVPQFDAAIDPELRERFRGEALSAGQLQHPGIVALYDVGQHAGIDYLAMAYVEGMTLSERLQSGPLPPADAARLVVQLATAVQHAHEQGVIHRDLKPGNVLLDKAGQPQVTDFGLARRLSESAMRATHTGQVLGTPAYMSPEQATGQSDIGPASDVYALGVILYETITGRPPFQAATFVEAVEFILNRDPLPPSKLNPKLPRELDAIACKCLEKRTAARYMSAQELAEDLQRFLDGRPIRARALGPVQRALRWARKYPSQALLLVATMVLIGLLLTMGVVYQRWQHADALAAEQRTSAETQRYYATVNQARNIVARRKPGWSALALEELERAAAIEGPAVDRAELRQMAVECLTGFDLQKDETIAAGMLIGRLASSADGSLLAVGELKGNASFRVVVYEMATRKPLHTFTILNGGWTRAFSGAAKWQDGVREFAFSSDNRYLAVGLRFGTVYCFDLQNPKQTPKQLTVSKERELSRMAFSADGQALFAITKVDDQFIRWQDWQRDAQYDSPSSKSMRSFAVAPFGQAMFLSKFERTGSFQMTDADLQPRDYFSPLSNLPEGTYGLLESDGDGSLLAARTDYGLQVFETLSGTLVRRLQDDTVGEESVAHDLKFSRDGQLLTAFHERGLIRFFDLALSRQVLRLDLPRHDFQDFAVDPERRWLAVANDDQLEFWRLPRQPIRRVLNSASEYFESVAFSPDGQHLACIGSIGPGLAPYRTTLAVHRSDTGELLVKKFSGIEHRSWIAEDARLAWSPTGKELIAGTLFGSQVYRFDGNELTSQNYLPLVGPTTRIELSPRRSSAAKGNHAPLIEELPHPADPEQKILKVTPHSQLVQLHCRLAAPVKFSGLAGMLAISMRIDAGHSFSAPLTVQTTLPHSPPHRVAPWTWISHGERFHSFVIGLPPNLSELGDFELHFVSQPGVRSFEIERIDFVALTMKPAPEPSLQTIEHFTAAPQADRIWNCLKEQVVSWSWPTGEKLTTWQNPNHRVTGAGNVRAMHAGKTGTLVGTRDGRVHWLDPKTGVSRVSWAGPGTEVVTAELCEEAQLALVASETGVVRGLSLPGGEVQFDLPADDAAIVAMAATPDGSTLVTASAHRSLVIWKRSASSGQYELYCRLPPGVSAAQSLSLSADGNYLAVLSRITGTAELWNVPALTAELQRLGIE